MGQKNKLTVLCSALPLPFEGIGSWTFEFNHFLSSTEVFDFILSPNPVGNEQFLFCKKKELNRLFFFLPESKKRTLVYEQYISSLLKITGQGQAVKILVVDDQSLLLALAEIKGQLPKGSELIYYHHGHLVNFPIGLMNLVDQVFFLTHTGYRESLKLNLQFTPEVKILGNGVSNEIFYPLDQKEKEIQRKSFGIQEDEIVISWLSNSRPVKGIHLFLKMIPKLLALDLKIRILIIGEPNVELEKDQRVKILGVLAPEEIAKYLQVSDFYFFTSLWKEGFGLSLVEAIKCGNYILCPNNGGIAEVVEGYPKLSFVEDPNIISNWILEFKKLLESGEWKKQHQDLEKFLSEFHTLEAWTERMKEALT